MFQHPEVKFVKDRIKNKIDLLILDIFGQWIYHASFPTLEEAEDRARSIFGDPPNDR